MSTMTIKLSKPIVAHGEELSELTLEEPTLGALDKVHVVADGEGTVRIDLGDVHRLIASMAGIPPTAARGILIKDIAGCLEEMMRFLGLQ